ncbi:MAG: hypothetical protein QE285_02685, partial [Aquabacterium sp.]|nr:hypothetical protein [Aquabacterium sp.]
RYDKLSALDPARVQAAVDEGRARGFAFLDSAVVAGTAAVGVAWPSDNPVAAVSVAAISSRLDVDRRVEVAAVLQRQALRLTRMLVGLNTAAGA